MSRHYLALGGAGYNFEMVDAFKLSYGDQILVWTVELRPSLLSVKCYSDDALHGFHIEPLSVTSFGITTSGSVKLTHPHSVYRVEGTRSTTTDEDTRLFTVGGAAYLGFAEQLKLVQRQELVVTDDQVFQVEGPDSDDSIALIPVGVNNIRRVSVNAEKVVHWLQPFPEAMMLKRPEWTRK